MKSILLAIYLGLALTPLHASENPPKFPKFSLILSEKLITSSLLEVTDDTTFSQRELGGSTVDIAARTQGRSLVELMDNDIAAAFWIHFDGVVDTKINAFNYVGSGVNIYSEFALKTQCSAGQIAVFNVNGTTYSPIYPSVSTSGIVSSVDVETWGPFWRIKDRMAWRKAPPQVAARLPHVQYTTNKEIEQKLSSKVEAKISSSMDKLWSNLQDQLVKPLTLSGYEAQDLKFSSSKQGLFIQWLDPNTENKFASKSQVDSDLDLSIQEDFIQALTSAKLKGKTVTEDELGTLLPFPSDPGTSSSDKLIITFADTNPLTVQLRPNEFTMAIRTKLFQKEGVDLPPLNIKVRYQLMTNGSGKITLQRSASDLLIYPPRREGDEKNTDGLTDNEIALKLSLKRRLNKILKTEMTLETIALPLIEKRSLNISLKKLELKNKEITLKGDLK